VVCVKQVPDTASNRTLRTDGTLDRQAADGLINELDEYAIEAGLKIADFGVVGDLFTVIPSSSTKSATGTGNR
jgi:electron transfer flavoprotein beta subunit